MDNKELNEILQEYAKSTQLDKDIAFKKLNEKPQPEKRTKKRFKPQYVLSIVAVCVIAVVLCTVLPLTLTNDSPQNNGPTFCDMVNIDYRKVENISYLKNEYHIDAFYPDREFDGTSFFSIYSLTDSTLAGAKIEYVIFEDSLIFTDLVIIPKTHILEDYQNYFAFENEQKWGEYDLKYNKADSEDTLYINMQIYFTDGKYDYFVDVNSDEELEPTELLNIIYG